MLCHKIMKYKHVFYISICFIGILGIYFVNPLVAFSQGKEYQRLRTTSQGSIVPSKRAQSGDAFPEYYISSGDKLEIYVWQNGDLTRDVTVRPDGQLSYPLIGTIRAAGLTIDQLQDTLKEKFSLYVRNPQVTVSVKEPAGSKIIVLGWVNYPGIFTFTGALSVLDAIAMAGDFTIDAGMNNVIVVSDNFTEHPKVREVHLFNAIRNGISSKENIMLRPNDLVYVPRARISDFNKFLSNIQPTLSTISTILNLRTNIKSVN